MVVYDLKAGTVVNGSEVLFSHCHTDGHSKALA